MKKYFMNKNDLNFEFTEKQKKKFAIHMKKFLIMSVFIALVIGFNEYITDNLSLETIFKIITAQAILLAMIALTIFSKSLTFLTILQKLFFYVVDSMVFAILIINVVSLFEDNDTILQLYLFLAIFLLMLFLNIIGQGSVASKFVKTLKPEKTSP